MGTAKSTSAAQVSERTHAARRLSQNQMGTDPVTQPVRMLIKNLHVDHGTFKRVTLALHMCDMIDEGRLNAQNSSVLSQSWGRTAPPQGWSALRARYTKTVGAANRASRDARAVVLLRLKVDLHHIDIPVADLLRDLREKDRRPCTLRVLPHRPTRNSHEAARKCSMVTECCRTNAVIAESGESGEKCIVSGDEETV